MCVRPVCLMGPMRQRHTSSSPPYMKFPKAASRFLSFFPSLVLPTSCCRSHVRLLFFYDIRFYYRIRRRRRKKHSHSLVRQSVLNCRHGRHRWGEASTRSMYDTRHDRRCEFCCSAQFRRLIFCRRRLQLFIYFTASAWSRFVAQSRRTFSSSLTLSVAFTMCDRRGASQSRFSLRVFTFDDSIWPLATTVAVASIDLEPRNLLPSTFVIIVCDEINGNDAESGRSGGLQLGLTICVRTRTHILFEYASLLLLYYCKELLRFLVQVPNYGLTAAKLRIRYMYLRPPVHTYAHIQYQWFCQRPAMAIDNSTAFTTSMYAYTFPTYSKRTH